MDISLEECLHSRSAMTMLDNDPAFILDQFTQKFKIHLERIRVAEDLSGTYIARCCDLIPDLEKTRATIQRLPTPNPTKTRLTTQIDETIAYLRDLQSLFIFLGAMRDLRTACLDGEVDPIVNERKKRKQ